MDDLQSEGIMLILSSPSGAGKTTISNELISSSEGNLIKSISVTTRKPRPGEVNDKDYRFIDEKEFFNLRDTGQMLEYAKVFDNYYGIPKGQIEDNLKNGISVLFNIDWQGAFRLFQIMKEKIVSIFILPPSIKELESRLKKRNGEPLDVIKSRLRQACFEMSHCYVYDYVIVNHNVDESAKKIMNILYLEKLKTKRKRDLQQFLSNMSKN